MCEMTPGNCLRIQCNTWFHVRADSEPEVGSCHGVPWELDQHKKLWCSKLQRWESVQELELKDLCVGSGWTSEM